jgi:MFS superfamily sulfate permease-like transporter
MNLLIKLVLVVFGLILAFSLLIVVVSFSVHSNPNYMEVGEVGYLKSENGSDIFVGVTKSDYEEMVQALVAKDKEGLLQLALSGQMIFVESGTQVRVIGTAVGAREIRILEGKYYGNSGWAAQEEVHKEK